MKISDLMSGNFSVIDAEWTKKRAVDATSGLESGYVIVRKAVSGQSGIDFYLLALEEFQRRLSESPAGRIAKILNLASRDPAPTFAATAIRRVLRFPGVVLADNVPVGVAEPTSSASASRGPGPSPALVPAPAPAAAESVTRRGAPARTGRSVDDAAPGETGESRGGKDTATGDGAGSDGTRGTRTRRGGKSPDGEPAVRRFLVGDLARTVKRKGPIPLTVKLTAKATAGGNAAGFDLPPGTKVNVIVDAREHLRVAGTSVTTFEVLDPQEDQSWTFALEADGTGLGSVEICAFHNGASIATLSLLTEIVEELPDGETRAKPASVPLDLVQRTPPDLSLFIFERDKEISFYLQSADGEFTMNSFAPVVLRTPREYFQDFFRAIEKLPLDTAAARRKAKEKLAEQGLDLFGKAVPADLQEVLWKLHKKVRTLQISSDEPWIPWEVCKLQGVGDNGRIEEGPFFAEAFSVTRWFRGVPAVTRLALDRLALVVPKSDLAKAPDEKKYLHGLGKGARKVVEDIEANAAAIKKAMATGEYDAWHFTGHARAAVGIDADQSAIELDANESFTPAQITGATENVLQSRPIVFLNACQSARSGMSLAGAGGWAERLVKVKPKRPSASAFIGTYWSVDDDKAFAFAKVFYDALIGGKTIGDAARMARLEIQAQDDPAWLAYTVYADPSATVA